MAESENIKEVVNQAAIQAAVAVIMVLRDVEAGHPLTTVASNRKPQRQRHSQSVLAKPAFNWGAHARAH